MDRTIVLLDAGTGGFVIQENSIRTIPKVSGYLLRHLGTLSVLAQTLEQDLHGVDADTELNALIMQVADLAIKRLETSATLASNLAVPVVATLGTSTNPSMPSVPEAIMLEPVVPAPALHEVMQPKPATEPIATKPTLTDTPTNSPQPEAAATEVAAAEDVPSQPAANASENSPETVLGSGESGAAQPTEIKAETASPVKPQPDSIEPIAIEPAPQDSDSTPKP
jgi:hypothetical protein